ncbi:hypothetical protein B5807_07581 [Epicoccum nigrum]|uniref:Tc toxin complex TcA C-terminal TcB-binding domain-containing protein n=1 Tax=Epicoccum nigrum TaxID=105696 RepID=A0A1Y2LY72_EPING|nr:hypothetical protein B5807_07581 [Epicoccum nigrum]
MATTKLITGDQLIVLTTVSPYKLEDPDLLSYSKVYLFANRCKLNLQSSTNQITRLMAKELNIYTGYFTVSDPMATISTAGNQGHHNIGSGSNMNGTDASPMFFSAHEFDVGTSMQIDARGGDGAPGFSPRTGASEDGANGGNGGNGADMSVLLDNSYGRFLDSVSLVTSAATPTEWLSNVQSWIKLAKSIVTQPEHLILPLTGFDRKYKSTTPDQVMSEGFMTDLTALVQAIDAEGIKFMTSIDIHCDGGSFEPGGKGTADQGKNGKSGNPGTYSMDLITPENIRNSTERLYHPDQIAMVLRDVENACFTGAISEAQAYLNTLISRLGFSEKLKKTDLLYVAYATKETLELHILPSSGAPTSISSPNKTFSSAKQYGRQLNQYLDLYGHSQQWVPTGSFRFYEAQLTATLSDFTLVKTDFWTYQDMPKNQANRAWQIKAARQAATQSRDRAAQEMLALESELNSTADRISKMSAGIPKKRSDLDGKIKEIAADINHHFSVSLSDCLGAAAQMAFSPGWPMTMIQGATLLNTAATEIIDDMDQKVKKEYLVNSIMGIKADIDGLKEAVSMQKGDPNLHLDDEGATKLLAEEKDLMNLVGKYRGVLGGDTLKDLRTTFDEYIHAVLERNNQIIHYNACVTLWLKADSTKTSSDNTLSSLGAAEMTKVDSEIPSLSVAIERYFYQTTSKILETMYLTQRALRFWSLSDSEVDLSVLRSRGFPRRSLTADLKSAMDKITIEFSDAVVPSKAITESEIQGFDSYQVYLTEDQLDDLLAGDTSTGSYGTKVTFPPAYKDITKAENVFTDCADARINRVRFYFDGAVTGDGKLLIDLEHLGSETIVSSDNTDFHFMHNALGLKFQYDLKTGAIDTDCSLADEVRDMYALWGPFASWRISVSAAHNDKRLNLSKVTKAWFEFSGHSRSFGQ